MLEPRKRTALDKKSWWCVFDTETMKWSTLTCFGKYKTKRDCQYAIDKFTKELIGLNDYGTFVQALNR